jgi:hypothetical protein
VLLLGRNVECKIIYCLIKLDRKLRREILKDGLAAVRSRKPLLFIAKQPFSERPRMNAAKGQRLLRGGGLIHLQSE